MGRICEDSTYRLTRPEALIAEISRYLRRMGCEVIENNEALSVRCGDCLITARSERLGHDQLIRDLGTLGELAAIAGAGDVRLTIEVSEGCGEICERIRWRALMRGGG